MIKSVKIRLKPTKDQEVLMMKSCGVARFTYNWGLTRWEETYRLGNRPNKYMLKKEFFNTVKKQPEYSWLNDVSSKVISQSFEDLDQAYQSFFKGKAKFPKYKTKKNSRFSFYVRYDGIKFKDGRVHLEKIGKVVFKTNYSIPQLDKYVNPRCSYDGKYWYLTFGYEHSENQVELDYTLSIGVDLGIKSLATLSTGQSIKNINKTKVVRRLKKRLKRKQRQVSRKYEMNKQKNQFIKTKNIIKLEKEIKLIYRRLTNIRRNHVHQTTNFIIKQNPYRVVVEDLNVKGMMKNRHLSRAIGEQNFFEFKHHMSYKCKFNGIEFVVANRFFPSSKKCSRCHHLQKDLKLKTRIYKCKQCGLEIDRDLNASVNLSRYELV